MCCSCLYSTTAGAALASTTAGAALGLPSAGTTVRPCYVADITLFLRRAAKTAFLSLIWRVYHIFLSRIWRLSREFVNRGDFHLLAKLPFRECIERESVEPTVYGRDTG